MSIIGDIGGAPEEERRGVRVSNLILILWIVTLAFNMVAYNMASNAISEGQLGRIRTYFIKYMDVLLVYIVSFIFGFLLSALIFYSIARYGRRDKIYLLGGVLFMISGIFDILSAFYTYKLRTEMEYVVKNLPLISIDELYDLLFKMDREFIYYINLYNIGSIMAIGGAFIFFGLSAILLARTLSNYLVAPVYPTMIPPTHEEGSEEFLAKIQAGEIDISEFKKAISDIRISGILFMLTGIIDLLAFIEIFQALLTFAFFLFLIGMYFESRGYKRLQRLQLPVKGGFSEIFG